MGGACGVPIVGVLGGGGGGCRTISGLLDEGPAGIGGREGKDDVSLLSSSFIGLFYDLAN